jgi:hypothetical protein
MLAAQPFIRRDGNERLFAVNLCLTFRRYRLISGTARKLSMTLMN